MERRSKRVKSRTYSTNTQVYILYSLYICIEREREEKIERGRKSKEREREKTRNNRAEKRENERD